MKSFSIVPVFAILIALPLLEGCEHFGKDPEANSAASQKKKSGPAEEALPHLAPNGINGVLTRDLALAQWNALAPRSPNDVALGNNGSQRSLATKLKLSEAWKVQYDCSAFRMGLIDSGVDEDHPDLIRNLDPTVHKNLSSMGASDDVRDRNGHGTHVAGILAAEGNNLKGGAGICWKAKLAIVRVGDTNGFNMSSVVEGIEWLLERDTKLINASLGAHLSSLSSSEKQSVRDVFAGLDEMATEKDALIVTAAGNESLDLNNTFYAPAGLGLTRFVSVGSQDQNSSDNRLSDFSNHGNRHVLLSAPGESIFSTYLDAGYARSSGTSMAAPFVTGTLALMWSHIGTDKISGRDLIELLVGSLPLHARSHDRNRLTSQGYLDASSALKEAFIYRKLFVDSE